MKHPNLLKKTIPHLIEKYAVEWCQSYGEPGYTDPENGVLLANWNDVPDGIGDWLEKNGFECEWFDEWVIDYNASRSKAYRTIPSFHGWKPSYICNDWTNGEVIGVDEIEKDEDLARDYLYECLLDKPDTASLANINDLLDSEGFTKLDEKFENGWHVGMNDDPHDIAKTWNKKGYHVVFTDLNPSQFYATFTIWTKPYDTQEDN